MRSFTFNINHDPVSKGRPRFRVINKWVQVYTDANTRKYEKLVSESYIKSQDNPGIIEKPLVILLVFYMPIPVSISNKKRTLLNNKPHVGHKDLDNLVKSVLDGLNSVAFIDDRLIYSINAMKVYSDQPRTSVTLIWDDIYYLTIGEKNIQVKKNMPIYIDGVKHVFIGIKNIGDKIPNVPCIYVHNNKVYRRLANVRSENT